jgi:hypothetical protein
MRISIACSCSGTPIICSVWIRVARWFFFEPKIPIWVNFGGSWNRKSLYILWPFGLFYGHWKCFTDIWSILCSLGEFFPVLVFCCTTKNLATLHRLHYLFLMVTTFKYRQSHYQPSKCWQNFWKVLKKFLKSVEKIFEKCWKIFWKGRSNLTPSDSLCRGKGIAKIN